MKGSDYSKASSSFGDPLARFEAQFQSWANEDLIPGLDAKKTYQVYVWKNGTFGHYSIVIGCKSRADVGFVTMELNVDMKNQKVIPVSKFIAREQGNKLIEEKKWNQYVQRKSTANTLMQSTVNILIETLLNSKGQSWNWEVQTTMRSLVKLTIDLIKHHGKYSVIANSCHDFTNHFAKKCAEFQDGTSDSFGSAGVGHGGAAASALGGSLGGGLAGAATGAAAGGPPGAAVGAFYGMCGGFYAGAGSFAVARSLHNNQHAKVKLDNGADKTKTTMQSAAAGDL